MMEQMIVAVVAAASSALALIGFITIRSQVAARSKGAVGNGSAISDDTSKAPRAFVSVTPELQAIVGTGPLTRSQVTSKVWDYIKKNGLNADTKMEAFEAKSRPRVRSSGSFIIPTNIAGRKD